MKQNTMEGMSNIKTRVLVLTMIACIALMPTRVKAQVIPPLAQMNSPVAFPFSDPYLSLQGRAVYAFTARQIRGSEEPRGLGFRLLDSAILQQGPAPDSTQALWMRFQVHNTGTKDTSLVLNSMGMAPLMYLYTLKDGRLVQIGSTGYELPYSRQSIRGDQRRIPFLIKASADEIFYICFKRYHEELGVFLPALQKRETALFEFGNDENKKQSGRIIEFFLGGFFLAISVYSLLKFFSQSRDSVYLLYALINFFCCLGTTAYYNVPNLENALWPWLRNNKEICSIFSDLTIVLNFLFFTALLNTRVRAPVLYRITWVYIVFHLVVTIVLPVWASPPGNLRLGRITAFLIPLCEVLCLLLDFLFVIHLYRRRKGFYRYLFYGISIMTLGMLLFTLSSIFRTHEAFISKTGDISEYIIMGSFIFSEVWFFIMALTQREKQTELENTRYQEELIAQLSFGKTLQENFSKSLERQVAERSEQIVEQQRLLEEERRDKLLAVLNRRISETELKALRSQMNPHFIFNSLNSIENFMMKNDKRMASDYFGKFASLIRMILDSSRNETVPFDRDMNALQLYVELEQLRFDNKFSYHTRIDPDLLNNNYNVPPLLIQPYVENAIIHGLAQSDGVGLVLQVEAILDGDKILYTVQDNGIGRTQAMIYQHQNKNMHRSMGMEITRQRIDLFNRHASGGGSVSIIDLYDEDSRAAGTRIQVTLKVV